MSTTRKYFKDQYPVQIVVTVCQPNDHWEVIFLEQIVYFRINHPQYKISLVLINNGGNPKEFQSVIKHSERLGFTIDVIHQSTRLGKFKSLLQCLQQLPVSTECIIWTDWSVPFGAEGLARLAESIRTGTDSITLIPSFLKNKKNLALSWMHYHTLYPLARGFSRQTALLLSNCETEAQLIDTELLRDSSPTSLKIISEKFSLRQKNILNIEFIQSLMRQLFSGNTCDSLKISSSQNKIFSITNQTAGYTGIHVDDFGLNIETNRAIKKTIEVGIVDSVSVMVDMPEFHDAVQFLKNHPNVKVGLHVNLTDGKRYPSIFFTLCKSLLSPCYKLALEREIERQYLKLKLTGLEIYQIDSHKHPHAFYPLFEIFYNFAIRHQIPQIRRFTMPLGSLLTHPSYRPTFKSLLICLSYAISWKLLRVKKPCNRNLYDLNWSNSFSKSNLENLFKNLPKNSEIMCHLSDRVTSFELSQERYQCYSFLMQQDVKKLLLSHAVSSQ